MSLSEIPPPPEVEAGFDLPHLQCRPPGPQSRSWLTRTTRTQAPMGPAPSKVELPRQRIEADVPAGVIVYATATGSNVLDVDGNRYVDLAAGFGALLLGHGHPAIKRIVALQMERLALALGDVYPADAKIALVERLSRLHPEPGARVILGQSGSDAVAAALKTAALATGRPGVIAFRGAYHGLGYGPLSALGLRESYRAPFAEQLNPHIAFVSYPSDASDLDASLQAVRDVLMQGGTGAVLVEPVLGRGGCVVPPSGFLPELGKLARESGAVLIADEIWTALGRSGRMLFSATDAFVPDIFCVGKGLGGGLPVSACIGTEELMLAWRREAEVVHTSTFAGAPLACAAAIALLDTLSRERLVERSARLGRGFLEALENLLLGMPAVRDVRGAGLMIGIDLGERPGAAVRVQRRMLERGYIVSTGGGGREVVVLTPALTVGEEQLEAAALATAAVVGGFG
jgi:4-aminobutyrate aminotransferase / (S)-3-amino-2-methylpropionate transaminase / 5-aminovalerate transaminase